VATSFPLQVGCLTAWRDFLLTFTGNCNAFDDEASGYCRSDAVGTVILKRLEDAKADKDPIFGVIRGAYTNHCGQTESITRPHEGDQAAVFKRIIRHANVDPLDVGYVEMHGTGTQAGDATEMNSVLSVFVPKEKNRSRAPKYPLYLGSAKANIGHAESASGVSSLIKVLMMLKHSTIPPHCGIKTRINHNYPLDLKDRNVNIAFEPTTWSRESSVNGRRSAFLNNFSAAGGNTAILLEDAPSSSTPSGTMDTRPTHVVTLSAKSSKSLAGNILALTTHLEANPSRDISKLSYTTTARRMHHNYRIAVTGTDVSSITTGLRRHGGASTVKAIPIKSKIPKLGFVFTGQGSLYVGVGKQLFESMTLFRADILNYDCLARRHGFPSFLPLVDGTATSDDGNETIVAHLAVTCVQMALSRLWTLLGLTPAFTIGHSLGEYAALFAAGVLTASDVIYMVGCRAQLLSKHCQRHTHCMLAIKAPFRDVEAFLSGTSNEIACINHQKNTVVSGTKQEIEQLEIILKSRNIGYAALSIPYAFHSAQVDPILDAMESNAQRVKFHAPIVPYLSPLLASPVKEAGIIDASYLAKACRGQVNFQGALESARNAGLCDDTTVWLEIGAHPACSNMIKATLGSSSRTLVSLREGINPFEILTSSLEALYVAGYTINWDEWHRDFPSSHQVIELPRYSWDNKNYWIMYKNDFCLTKGDDVAPVDRTNEQKQEPPASYQYISPSVQRVLEESISDVTSTLLIESDIHDQRLSPVFQGHLVNGVALCPSVRSLSHCTPFKSC
jgi:naphtho-gamma-pyrone polyketide synthase